MNKEQLFEALEEVNEKYIYQAGKNMYKENLTDISRFYEDHPQTEGAVKVKIVNNRKKIRPKTAFILAAVLIILSATAAVFFAMKKDKTEHKEYKEKKITNYFRKDEQFSIPEKLLYTEEIAGYEDKFYMTAYIGQTESNYRVSLYNIKENKRYDIELEENTSVIKCFTGNNNLWLSVSKDEGMTCTLLRINRDTLKTETSLKLQPQEYISELTEDSNGTVRITSYTLTDGEISDVYFSVYDENLKEQKRENLIDKTLIKDHLSRGFLTDDTGNHYMFYSDENDYITLCKYSEDGRLLYTKEDICSDMPGQFVCAFMSAAGNPTVASYDNDLYYFNETDPKTGETCQRYETDFDGQAESAALNTGYIQFIDDKSNQNYDFVFADGSMISGVSLSEDKIETIIDFSSMTELDDVSVYSPLSAAGENEILFSYTRNSDEEGLSLYITDTEGNVKGKHYFGSQSYIDKIYACRGGAYLLLSSYDSTSFSESNRSRYICRTDDQGNLISQAEINSDIDGIRDFIVTDDERIIILDYSSNIFILGKDASEISRIESKDTAKTVEGVFSSQSEEYALIYDYSDSFEIRRINYENNSLEPVCSLEEKINKWIHGNGEYELIFDPGDGLYGYDLRSNSTTELINWLDSDISTSISKIACANSDIVMYSTYDIYKGYTEQLNIIHRVDDETLRSIQNRKLINVACTGYISQGIKAMVSDFNSSNDSCRIHLEDYTKYSSSVFCSRLDEDIVNGSIPDVVLSGDNFDINRYAMKGAFEDLNKYMETSPEINRQDYFENVLDAYSTAGKQYCIPLSFSLDCLAGKKSVLGDINKISFDEFFRLSEQKDLFCRDDMPYEFFTDFFINSNLSEYVDFENKKCSFDNENFIKLLEIIKESGIDEETYNQKLREESADNREALSIIENKSVFHPALFGNFSQFANTQQTYMEEEASFIGLPSGKNSGAVLIPVCTAAVFSSSENKDDAWNFVKMLLTEEGQKACVTSGTFNVYYDYALKKSVYDTEVQAEKNKNDTVYVSDAHGNSIKLKKTDQKTFDKIYSLITSASTTSSFDSRISEIISEQTDKYYSGAQSAEETAGAIQSKVTLYLKEIA